MTTNLINRQTSNPQKLSQMLNAQDTFLNEVYTKNIIPGNVLLTIRPDNRVTAYFKGVQLFSIKDITDDHELRVYRRYLPIIRSNVLHEIMDINRISSKQPMDKSTMTESDWRNKVGQGLKLSDVRLEILDNLKKDSRPESSQVSCLYKFSPIVAHNASDIVLLDIEAAFSQSGTRKSDRVDVVLFHTIKKQLLFLEVKRLSDKRVYPQQGNTQPSVTSQLGRYQTIINDQSANIMEQYNNVIDTYSVISGKQLSHIDLDSDIKLGLLVLEYGRKDSSSLKAIRIQTAPPNAKTFSIGHAKHVTAKTLERWFV